MFGGRSFVVRRVAPMVAKAHCPRVYFSSSSSTAGVERHAFQAETSQLLKIAAQSLYTDKEVFLRELISNASDACQKVRYLENTGEQIVDSHVELGIHITVNADEKVLVIEDRGIGMTREELKENLGTIAKSGTRAFAAKHADMKDVIGQFGVGFYSAFMVANSVKVFSKSAIAKNAQEKANLWESDISGYYTVQEADQNAVEVPRGTRIELHLNESSAEFAKPEVIEKLVSRYSSFIGVPITVNGKRINTVSPIWTSDPKKVTEKDYHEFYRFAADAYDEPRFHLHFSTDYPVQLRSIIFVPRTHVEKFGMGRQESGIALYSRKVLIQKPAKNLVPDWMRFLKGVVDCEDIPLNISRESMQDTRLMNTINTAVSRKVLSWLKSKAEIKEEVPKEEEATAALQKEEYDAFFREFGVFIKEGAVVDQQNRDQIAPLLRFESSKTRPGEFVSLDVYTNRNPGSQILFVQVPSRALAEKSPYIEAFIQEGIEVLYSFDAVDEFLFNALGQYRNRKFLSASSSEAQKLISEKSSESESKDKDNLDETEDGKKKSDGDKPSGAAEDPEFSSWVQSSLSDRVDSVSVVKRASSTPLVVLDHESPMLRKMMKMAGQGGALANANFAKHQIQVFSSNPIMQSLANIRKSDEETAALIVEQLFENALVTAGIMDEPREMVPRINKIIELALKSSKPQ
ncbi:mitochondrial Hsp75 (Hsp90 family protein) [Andalucia godoyi]|uniref:Mitochondrial Hsp75 (Hsp90 family protein) n=1 Tax=Andalucia godoyi TaxID=505711 RepID=A0A8K0F4I2_ANDGO|nr:mitochondrial Hsp75 (Hsp90 family protein) [Andalucia godoyi]|eukprot:ANDGO_05479.mRNA.1 mitochondrial Hsp75 (Hsp90 family protein)